MAIYGAIKKMKWNSLSCHSMPSPLEVQTVNVSNGVVTSIVTQSAAPAYCAKDYTRDTADHVGKSMTTSLVIQDRKNYQPHQAKYMQHYSIVISNVVSKTRVISKARNHEDQRATQDRIICRRKVSQHRIESPKADSARENPCLHCI